jgi:hypothetical protein
MEAFHQSPTRLFFFFFLVGFSSWMVIVFQSGKVKEVEWGTSINHLFIYFFFFFFFKLEGEETIQLPTYHFSETFQPTIIHFLSSFFWFKIFFHLVLFFPTNEKKKGVGANQLDEKKRRND